MGEGMDCPGNLLFVYGTLKRGFCRAPLLAAEQFLCESVTQPCYRLLDCGEYPGLIESDLGMRIRGEIWRVGDECLEEIDRVEDVVGGLYVRQQIKLEAEFNQRVLGYLYNLDTVGLRDCGESWEKGKML